MKLSDVRTHFSEVFPDEVVRDRPVPIARGGKKFGMLVGIEEIARLVEAPRLNQKCSREQGLLFGSPSFGSMERGKDLAAARRDLLGEVRDYVLEYLQEIDRYRSAPNRRAHFPHVVKALAADLSGHLDSVIFADRPATQTENGLAAAIK